MRFAAKHPEEEEVKVSRPIEPLGTRVLAKFTLRSTDLDAPRTRRFPFVLLLLLRVSMLAGSSRRVSR